MKRKALALLLSIAMLTGICVPGTFAAETGLVCGQTEHTHTEQCYEETLLTCTVEEHTHADTCYAGAENAAEEEDTSVPTDNAENAETSDPIPAISEEGEESEPDCTCENADGRHTEGCPFYAEPTEPAEVTRREITDGVVTVEGLIPENVKLVVEDYSAIRTFSLFHDEKAPLARLNITLYNPDGSEWQPESGSPVSVTLDAEALALKDGHGYIISHIHDDGNNETTTNFSATPEDGKMTFELSGFSYILVFDGTTTISGIETFYKASLNAGVNTTNGQLAFLGVYYDSDNLVHFLIAATANNFQNAYKKISTVQIDNEIFPKTSDNCTAVQGVFHDVQLKDDSGAIVDTIVSNGTYSGYFDIVLPQGTVLRDGFEFGINGDISGSGWKVGGDVDIGLDYDLTKTVAKGTTADADFSDSVTVERGDTVIYRILVTNKDRPLSGIQVEDILPKGVFTDIQASIGTMDGTAPDWKSITENDEILYDNLSCDAGFTLTVYIKATVKTDLHIESAAAYINTAAISGNQMPTHEDTAKVTVNPPTNGTLTVGKTVVSENPLDTIPNDTFQFTVTDVNGKTENFTLKSGEHKDFADFPNGSFTVTETAADGYTTTVNGNSGNTYTGTMDSYKPSTVAFLNRFSMRTGTLSITKNVNAEYENDVIPTEDTFTFSVEITGEGVPAQYQYTVGDVTDTLANKGTITLKNGQTAVISGIPVGAGYTVAETQLGEDYAFTSVTGGETDSEAGTSGKIGLGGASVTFTNTYKRHLADLTITKTGAENIDENQTFLFHVTGQEIDLHVVIEGNGSKTIKDLPLGTYTVTEETDWSWRYTSDESEKTITLTADGGTVAFQNTRNNLYWLNGMAHAVNKFLGVSATHE